MKRRILKRAKQTSKVRINRECVRLLAEQPLIRVVGGSSDNHSCEYDAEALMGYSYSCNTQSII